MAPTKATLCFRQTAFHRFRNDQASWSQRNGGQESQRHNFLSQAPAMQGILALAFTWRKSIPMIP